MIFKSFLSFASITDSFNGLLIVIINVLQLIGIFRGPLGEIKNAIL
ncbi:MAG: hypothetical protein Edafosvirus9_18 [Edafosvirus sp.]|uniref:Uncharacterized protein n=1 Tax=Edafosvirus sp. TaxID=2487765 RepID=A0A3G4ZVF1_9VIRU|nr:MAG: hypothetical protein Edafosvirus9_18 [Edafosvirus sp.]